MSEDINRDNNKIKVSKRPQEEDFIELHVIIRKLLDRIVDLEDYGINLEMDQKRCVTRLDTLEESVSLKTYLVGYVRFIGLILVASSIGFVIVEIARGWF